MSKKIAEKIRLIVNTALILVSCFMMVDGIGFFISTWGVVQGTSFQMLIVTVHILSVMMIWMAAYTFKKIIVGIITRKDTEVLK